MIRYDVALTVHPARRPRLEQELCRLAQGRRFTVVTIQPWELDLFREKIASRQLRLGTLVLLNTPGDSAVSARRPLRTVARRAGVRVLDADAGRRDPREEAETLIRKTRRA